VNNEDEAHRTALHYAAYAGELDIVDALIQSGADIHHRDRDLRTALHVASFKGHTEIVALILSTEFLRLRSVALRSFREEKMDIPERELAIEALQEYFRKAEDLRVRLLFPEDRHGLTCLHYALRDSYGSSFRTLEFLLSTLFPETSRTSPGRWLPSRLTEQRTQGMPSNTFSHLPRKTHAQT